MIESSKVLVMDVDGTHFVKDIPNPVNFISKYLH